MKHKVLLVLLLGIIISVSASAQKVTMNLKQVKLEKVFSAITQQTGLTVAYSRTIVNPDRIVTVEAKNQELSKVLNDLFLGTNINYEIGKTKIYLKEKVTDSEQQTSNANKRNISGRVVDEKGEPIIGASVMVQGSSLGTITNVDGRYTLANVPENSTITVSYIGYITVNYAATSRNLSQVVLREDSKTLEEVVVVGYGTQKKVNLTGAVAIVSGNEITATSISADRRVVTLALAREMEKDNKYRLNISGVKDDAGNTKALRTSFLYFENQEIPVLTGISGGGDFNLSFRLKTDKNAVSLLRQGKDISVDLDAEGRLTFVVKGVKVVSRQPVNNNKECIVSLCREKNGMLKIYLDGELEQSAYDVAIVNPGIKATPVIINASLEYALGQLKLINRALDYKENKNMALK